jgi:hypothetical protein
MSITMIGCEIQTYWVVLFTSLVGENYNKVSTWLIVRNNSHRAGGVAQVVEHPPKKKNPQKPNRTKNFTGIKLQFYSEFLYVYIL